MLIYTFPQSGQEIRKEKDFFSRLLEDLFSSAAKGTGIEKLVKEMRKTREG